MTCKPPSVVGNGKSTAMAPSGGPRLKPLICKMPPRPTVAGAGSFVKPLISPRGSRTGAVGACASAQDMKMAEKQRARVECIALLTHNPNVSYDSPKRQHGDGVCRRNRLSAYAWGYNTPCAGECGNAGGKCGGEMLGQTERSRS